MSPDRTQEIAIARHDSTPEPASGVRAPWLRFVIPSLSDFVFIVLLVALCWGGIPKKLLADAGIGWHIRNGDVILQTHAITRVDPFSATMSGHQWFAWEWLYDLKIASIHSRLGLNGVVLFSALIIATTFALTLRITLRRGASPPVALCLLVLAIGASTIHFLARPHVLSWLFAVVWFALLEASRLQPSPASFRKLWLLPLSMLLWVNLHGGFLTGFVLLAIYFLDSWWSARTSRPTDASFPSDTGSKTLAIVGLASFLASFVNPFGYKLYQHIFWYLSDKFLVNNIQEFQSPNFHLGAPQCFAALLLIAIFVVTIRVGRLPGAHLLLLVFAVYSGLYSSRNLPLSSILIVLVISPLLSQTVAESTSGLLLRLSNLGRRMEKFESNLRGHLWPLLTFVFGLVVCFAGGSLGSHKIIDAHFDSERFPVESVDWVEAHNIHDPIFAPDLWGGYLIYRLYPSNQVIVDDRHDLYGDDFLKNYLKLIRLERGWQDVLKKDNVKWLMMPVNSPLASMLRESPGWSPVHEDSTAVVFHLR